MHCLLSGIIESRTSIDIYVAHKILTCNCQLTCVILFYMFALYFTC